MYVFLKLIVNIGKSLIGPHFSHLAYSQNSSFDVSEMKRYFTTCFACYIEYTKIRNVECVRQEHSNQLAVFFLPAGAPSDQSSGTSSPLCDSGLHLNYHPNNTVRWATVQISKEVKQRKPKENIYSCSVCKTALNSGFSDIFETLGYFIIWVLW